jgi:hypothetical protein
VGGGGEEEKREKEAKMAAGGGGGRSHGARTDSGTGNCCLLVRIGTGTSSDVCRVRAPIYRATIFVCMLDWTLPHSLLLPCGHVEEIW